MWEEIKDWIAAIFITAFIAAFLTAYSLFFLWLGTGAQLELCKKHHCIHNHD